MRDLLSWGDLRTIFQEDIRQDGRQASATEWSERMAVIEIYTQNGCPYCSRAVALLSGKGVEFKEIKAPHGSTERETARARSNGRTTMPQIFIDGRHIGGCDDLMALNKTGELDPLLQAA